MIARTPFKRRTTMFFTFHFFVVCSNYFELASCCLCFGISMHSECIKNFVLSINQRTLYIYLVIDDGF